MGIKDVVIGTVIGGAVMTASPSAQAKYTPKVSIEKARATALERVPGTVIEEELEREKGRWIYEFEIRPKGETGRIIKEVTVDPETGAILAVETEEEDDDREDGPDDDDDEVK